MKLKVPTKVEIKDSEIHGLGVFATELIEKGEVIEECHLVALGFTGPSDLLKNYRFEYPVGRPPLNEIWNNAEHPTARVRFKLKNEKTLEATLPQEGNVIPLGYGCVYNHSNNNNATWEQHPSCKAFQYIAVKKIEAGEEICTNYGDVSRKFYPDSIEVT